MAEITSQADCGHHRCYGSCGYQQAAKPQAPTADELLAEVKRLRDAPGGLYGAMQRRHYGRMPDEVQKAFDAAREALEVQK